MTVQDFIKSLGGAAEVGRALNVPLTTVATWTHRNSIPHWRIGSLATLAQEKGEPVPASFDAPADQSAAA